MWCNVHLSAGAVSTPSLCPGDTCNSSICCTTLHCCYALLCTAAMHCAPQQPSTGTFFSIILIFRNIPASLNTFNRSSECRDSSVAFFILIVCAAWAWAPPWLRVCTIQCTSALYSVVCRPGLLSAPTPQSTSQLPGSGAGAGTVSLSHRTLDTSHSVDIYCLLQ